MQNLENVDLSRDPQGRRYIKDEVVQVRFPKIAGQVESREGLNRYAANDAVVTRSNGDCWSVTRDRFDAKYEAVPPLRHGEDGAYRNKPLPVLAKQMHVDFSVSRAAGGNVIHGRAGDWLMQYAPGDHGIVAQAKFAAVYRPAP